MVVFYHSGVVPVPAGFLGVDIFFVISGFLITSHIIRDVDRKNFSLRAFYLRRARRLLPATYCTLSFVVVAAYFLLIPSAWPSFIQSLFGALTFTANIVLWKQAGYFDLASTTKPLLHLWSLSVEEQFYLILPLFLLAVPGRLRLVFIQIALLSSLALCMYFVTIKPSATFFLLPTRAWQLLLGSLLAAAVAKYPDLTTPRALRISALAVILVVPFYQFDTAHPRFDALLVTVATTVLLAGRNDWLHFGVVTRALSRAGDWSYSIYLVHWPLYAFAANICVNNTPPVISAALIPVSYALGYLQYRYVEQPFRFGWQTNERRYLKYLVAASLFVALPIPIYVYGSTKPVGHVDFLEIRRVNFGLGTACDYEGDFFEDKPQCRLSGTPSVALWGDSFAMQWASGLEAALQGNGLIQMTKSRCGPLKGLAAVDTRFARPWAEFCIQFNESVLTYILQNPSIKTVLLSSAFGVYVEPVGQRFLIDDKMEAVSIDAATERFLETISLLRRAGRRVIVIAPPPSLGIKINIGDCLERMAIGFPVYLSGRSGCNFSYPKYLQNAKSTIGFLKSIEEKGNVEVIWPERVICSRDMCATQLRDTFLYSDAGHLTYDGSVLVVKLLKLDERLARH